MVPRFYRGNKNEQHLYGFGGCHLKIRDVCMDLEPCFKVHNLVVIQLNNTKLGQMTNLNVIFYKVCQFINCIKFSTHPSPLLNLKVANIIMDD